jgi:hypothetical protein
MGPLNGPSQLDDLVHHWGDAYVIDRVSAGLWLAQRRDNREMLRAESAEELHDLIVADYGAKPVAR